ncbi:MAG: hypothetical protein ACK481_11540 [Candidatus Melainabacteria bacterium]|jgi:hypothetical protein
MSSASGVSGGLGPSNYQAPGGLQMSGQMGEGGGSNFFMGEEGGQGEPQQQQQRGNPNLIVNQGEIDNRSQKRQYLETIITEGPKAWLNNLEKLDSDATSWFNPWDINRVKSTVVKSDKKKTENRKSQPKLFFINA